MPHGQTSDKLQNRTLSAYPGFSFRNRTGALVGMTGRQGACRTLIMLFCLHSFALWYFILVDLDFRGNIDVQWGPLSLH